jgi:TonB family protein
MKRRELIISVLISILIHILVVVSLRYIPNTARDDSLNPIEVFLDKPEKGWKIADIPEPGVQQKPDKSEFLGMYDQSVKEETVANGDQKAERGDQKSETRGQKSDNKGQRTETMSKRLHDFDKDIFTMKGPSSNDGTAVSSGDGSFSSVPEDFYPDYKKGDHTYINVLRYPDVEYFVRLKRMFKMTWDPVTALRRDVSALSVSRGIVSCVVAVSVDKGGSLSELFVLKSSGIANYDSEAIRTVRASSPFSSPPEKFLKDDGLLRMSWTFIIYL